MNTSAYRTMVLLTMMAGIMAVSTPAAWSSSPSFISQTYDMQITSPTTKTGAGTGTFPTAYAAVPKFFYGIYKISSKPNDTVLGFDVQIQSLSIAGFTYNWSIGASTTVYQLSMNVLSCRNDSSTSFISVSYGGRIPNTKISSGSGPREGNWTVNFTSISGQSMNTSNVIKVMLFFNGVTMLRNSGNFSVAFTGTFINTNDYILRIITDGNTTVTYARVSRFIFDQTLLQETALTFVDADIMTAVSTTWSQLSLSLVWKTASNFFIGFTAIAYQATSSADFSYDSSTLTCSGSGTFKTLSLGYWNYRYRTCPAGYPLFAATTNLCYPACEPYFYEKTSLGLCYPCSYQCYSCSNTTVATNCTSCDITVAHRVLNGTICQCDVGYYDAGVTICVICNYTCLTCTNGTGCATCLATNFRTLQSGQCPCNAGYIDMGLSMCVPCSTSLVGCTACSSVTLCTACDTANHFQLNVTKCSCAVGYYPSGTNCLACSVMLACQTCTSAAVCTSCNGALSFIIKGSQCSCINGTYLFGSNCAACSIGCLTCTSASVCTNCNIANKFVLASGSCSCSPGYSLSGTSCLNCSAGIPGCVNCTGASVCTNCNSSKFLTPSAGGASCVCISGYYSTGGINCVACSTISPACLTCSSGTNCLSCSAPLILNGTGACVCAAGSYVSGSICKPCNGVMPGCTACLNSTNCTICDVAANFVLVSGSCCQVGFYKSGTNCVACPLGCLSCDSSSVCTSCSSALHFVPSVINSLCDCDNANGYYLAGTVCQSCLIGLPGCANCAALGVCITCGTFGGVTLTLEVNGTCSCPATQNFNTTTNSCVPCSPCCSSGTFLNTTVPAAPTCDPCNSSYANCDVCTDILCERCASGYVLQIGLCSACSIIPGCLTCISLTDCSGCDPIQNLTLAGTTCVCAAGYVNSTTNQCLLCSDFMVGCLTCHNESNCTTCDLIGNYALDSGTSKCVCDTGFYFDITVPACVDCPITGSMAGCVSCSSATVCLACNASQFFVIIGSICSCDSGYYQAGSTCMSCAIMPGCLECTDSAKCVTCDTAVLFQPNGPVCQCVTGYYLLSGVCTPCPVGCMDCDSTGATCSSCDSTIGFQLVSQQCVCSPGTYLPSGGTNCVSCSSLYSMCLVCTEAGCTSCSPPAVVSGVGCGCASGYYNNTIGCALCSGQFLGCSTCTLGSCLTCDTSIFFRAVPVANQCMCQPGYIMIGSTCIQCSTLITGCSTCNSSSICTSCDSAKFFYMDSGHCLCNETYFFNATSQCQACNSTINGCYNCTANGSICLSCNATSHFAPLPLPDNTCGCASPYVLNGILCQNCMTSCVCYGYRWASPGNCLPFCSDNITITPAEECDDGNLVDGDGCSSACKIEPNFNCTLDANLSSSCSFSQPLNMTFINTFKSPNTNKLTFKLKIGPALPTLATVNFSQLFTPSVSSLSNPTFVYDPVNGTVSLTYDFNQSLQNQNISLTINPGVEAALSSTSLTVITFLVQPENNLPAIVYDNLTYGQVQKMDTVYKGAVYASYGVLTVGLLCDSTIGVELFGVLQLAHLALSNLDSVQPLLSPLMNMSIVHGYNIGLNRSVGSLPNRVREIQYDQLFLNNFNVMLGLMLLEMAIASVFLIVGALVPRYRRKKLTSIGNTMLKKYLLMMIIFNIYNISYSLGIQLAYPDSQHHLSILSTLLAVTSVLYPVVMVGAMIFTNKKELGEFYSHFKSDPVCKGYFILTLLYRMVLGQSMGRLNESEDATLVHVFYAVIFLLYILANRPYVKAYHNYRAVVVQASGLIILSVTMYYRSMKSTTKPDVAYQILSPALAEFAAIFTSLAISAACLFYELYLKIKKWTETQPSTTEKVWPLHHMKRENTEMDVIDNPHLPMP